jgi:hypothetical protein
MLKTPFMVKAVKKLPTIREKSMQHLGRRQLEEYVFDSCRSILAQVKSKSLYI